MPITVKNIVDALTSLGGQAHLDEITRVVTEIASKPLPVDVGASVRARIQERCSKARSYKHKEDLFYSVHGVIARQGWWGLLSDTLNPDNPDGFLDGAEAFIETEEGKKELRTHLYRERSTKLIRKFKLTLTSLACSACGFDFGKTYGELGAGYIEAHHVIPVASLEKGAKTKLIDLIAVCANCHRIIHKNGLMKVENLKAYLANRGP